ncbi:MAG: efflux RND transporter periplasmic adaptor subunit [Gammaproteobacteria bacterium]|nr:efflux RND transporter periplasmic adaptor subunit [Gammaproteobacteria bacterium]MBU1653770.1 efflux RND transporter periplasmic adaptor subunit [Gammaproteobacteria bacterium]MBU1962112.1 efflux RND transporter periplasmic adaptor subunit [Gammaproteobacteria bacterium]
MSKYVKWFLWLLILVAAVLWLRWELRPAPVAVKVARVERGMVERTLANTRAGSVKSCRRARLSPSLGGQIARLEIKEGDRVREGDLLLELWNQDLAAEMRLAESQTLASEASAKAACLRAEEARREADRKSRLKKSGAVSEETIDQALTQALTSSADCEAARAQTKVSEARLGVAQANLERTRLRAPFNGVVAKINGELEEYVTPSPPGIATLPVVDLVDDTCFYVAAPIDEVDAMGMRVGMTARISLDAFGDRRFDAEVRRIACYVLDVEKQARTVEVEAVFANSEDALELLAGYSADLEIVLEEREGALRIPTEAIQEGGKVLVFDRAEGLLKERKVEVGISNWKYSEVVKGLMEADEVVISAGKEGVVDGAAARIADEAGK